MTILGKYVVVGVVGVTARGSVSTARRAGARRPLFALKQYNSAQPDPDEPHWDCQQFLDRARVQRSVVAAGGRYWVAVHDMGLTPDGAWVVTDYHPLSAQKLIDAKVGLDAVALHNLVNSVVRGLVELQQVRRRPHGGLKPSNVLISGGGDLADARVMLTDPAQGVGEGEKGDLYALGELIHQLVLHRPFAGAAKWPLPEDEAWQRLGKGGEHWREICSALLTPQPAARPGLVEVSRLLRELAPAPTRRRLRKRRLLVPAAAACVLAAGLLTLVASVSSARREFARAKAGWIDTFAADLSSAERPSRYRADPDLRIVLDDFERSGLARRAVGSGLLSAFSPLELYRLHQANAAANQVAQDLSPQHWHRLADLTALREEYEVRGWDQPAGYVAKLIDATQPRPGAAIADGIDHLLRVQAMLDAQRPSVEAKWRQLDADAQLLERTRNLRLASFARALRLSASASVQLSDGGFIGLRELQSAAALTRRLADAVRPGWPGDIDVRRLDTELSVGVDLAHPRPGDIELWLAKVPLYRIRRDETAVAAAALHKRLSDAVGAVGGSIDTPDERARFEQDRKAAEEGIHKFARTMFVEKEMREGSFATRRSLVEAEVDALRKYAKPRAPADWLRALPDMATASQRINAYWDAWKKAQLSAAQGGREDRPRLAALKVRAEQMRTTLADLDRQFPPVPAELSPEFRDVARKHRDQAIARLLEGVNAQSPHVDALRVAGAASSFGEWCGSLAALARDFPIRKEFLVPDDKPDEKWSLQEALWNDPDVRQLLQGSLERLARLRALAGEDRPELIDAARKSDVPEVAFEAWRRLGQERIHPAWPTTPGELSTELELRRRLGRMLAALTDVPARSAAIQTLRQQGPVRWRNVIETARDEETLHAAWKARDELAAGSDQLDALSARARYNLWLWRVRQEIADNDDAAITRDVAQLQRAAQQLKDSPAAAATLAALSQDGGSFADQKPGDWFKVALLGVQPPVPFKRVEPKGGRPFYLSTTAVSLGQFVSVVDTAGAWEPCRKLPWPYRPGERDARRGPRVWEWTDGPMPKLAPPQLWLTPEQDNDFAAPLRGERFNRMVLSDQAGGMPSERDPMQYVSPETALWFAVLCGCRLPTAREWLAAYETYEKRGSPGQWNLRDRAWELQRAYVATASAGGPVAVGQWPDEGAFRPEGVAIAGGRDARSYAVDDGALFFRPVDASGGSTFHHLLGNVAEFVCDAPRQFEAIADKRSPRAIHQFVEQSASSLAVIGGSALSPPELPADKPLPLAHADRGYADVGFRLAFTAPARSVAERAKWALQAQPYLWPPASGIDRGPGT